MSNAPKARPFLHLLQEPSYPLHETWRGGVDLPDAFLDALPNPLLRSSTCSSLHRGSRSSRILATSLGKSFPAARL
ncbi:MAG: hypothetical protein CVV55_05075 [Synergistetes bacterium HGW-Synergistetes-2]|nr:MAG: hypothetical protein CVV55_05075 [Synergistetes bacterium HGW-Synergistetes-2]